MASTMSKAMASAYTMPRPSSQNIGAPYLPRAKKGLEPHSSSTYLSSVAKILYVEDEPFLAKIVKETLESNSYEVTLISDGSAASRAFVNDAYDICILDVMLPSKNGYDIAKDIRQSDSNIPILFLTAKDQTADVLTGFSVGGNDYIKKPFSMEELIVRIENLCNLAQLKSSKGIEEIQIGSQFRFYPTKLSLTSPHSTKDLSHRESQIIQLLCDHMNDITNRKEILMTVWGDDSFYNSRNLDVYISKIRGYFKEDRGIEIKTLKGVGYQFIIAR